MKRCAIVLLLLVVAAVLGSSGLALAGQETSKQAPVTVSAEEFLASLAAPTVAGSCASI